MARGTNKKTQTKNKAKSGQTNRNAGATSQAMGVTGEGATAIEMLKQDHRRVEELFEQVEQAADEQKEQLVRQLCAELIVHTRLKEDVFYPACRDAGVDEETLDKSQVAHDGAKALVNDLLHARSDAPYFEAKLSVLREMIRRQVAEEEKAGDGLLAQAEANDLDDTDLAEELAEYKQELQHRRIGRRPARPVAIEMSGDFAGSIGGERMDPYSGDNRFSGGNERGYGARQRYEEDEYEGGYDRSGRRSVGFEGDWNEGRHGASPEQQPPGRYEEDDRRRSRTYEEDRRYGRGQGGWFGDRLGHSEASRRGWDERRDDDWRRYRSPDDDDDRRRGRGHGGWFGDSRGHAEASRRGWQHRR